MTWMIYGASGYTGKLIAREAVRRGHRPVAAGRNRDRTQALASELGIEARVFGLNAKTAKTTKTAKTARTSTAAHIEGIELVLNCAGPFSATAAPMIEACLQAGAHYLDITGEIAVFELAQSLDARARAAGIVLCPGVGFDVIPTDCVAAALKAALPDATHLALGFDTRSGMSPGTAKTSLEGMAQGGKVRRDGKLVAVPMAHEVRRIDFGDGEKLAMTIPWGDVVTAYATTGIPNIAIFVPGSRGMIAGARRAGLVRPLLGLPPVQALLKALIAKRVKGPETTIRDRLPTYVWGEVRNARGEMRTARVRTANVYSLTITGALAVVEHVVATRPGGGATTPARLVGADLVTRLPGSGPLQIV